MLFIVANPYKNKKCPPLWAWAYTLPLKIRYANVWYERSIFWHKGGNIVRICYIYDKLQSLPVGWWFLRYSVLQKDNWLDDIFVHNNEDYTLTATLKGYQDGQAGT